MITLFDNIQTVEAETFNNQFSWEVKEQPIFTASGEIANYKAITRNDNGEVLNVCKSSYTPTTNEAFTDLVYKISDATGFEIQNFNEFQNGKKVLAFLKAGESSINGWNFENFMAIGNAHDGSKALFVALTNKMIRCQNQFTALSQRGLKAFHTLTNAAQIEMIRQSIGLYNEEQIILKANYNKLLSAGADEARTADFLKYMFDLEPVVNEDNILDFVGSRKANQISDLFEAIEIEKNDLGNNDFALFNGVTRWTTHTRAQKDKVFGNIFGSNAQLNDKALKYLLN